MKAVVKFLLALLAFFAIVTQTQAADDTKGQECEGMFSSHFIIENS